jgi:tetratricopeptide (TPR) repeat protein
MRAVGYLSSGSSDPATATRTPPVGFAPGALAATFLSADARTMREPPAQWKPSPAGINYAGSSQSLVGDLVRAGVTGVAGQVSEPYLAGTVRPDRLFPGYLSGLNLAEAFYRSIPALSWQTIVLGDPLCAPFREHGLSDTETSPALAPETELPAYYSQRRLAHIDPQDKWTAVQLRAQARVAKGNRPGATAALEEAVASGANSLNIWRMLGELHEDAQRYVQAADAYEHAVALKPDDVTALNNLSYLRAVYLHQPDAARAMAERALALSNGSPVVADTAGWIRHLAGDDAGAMPLIETARAALPGNAEVQLHAAIVYAAAGRLQEASRALKAAEAADRTIVTREEYVAVQRKLAGEPGPF